MFTDSDGIFYLFFKQGHNQTVKCHTAPSTSVPFSNEEVRQKKTVARSDITQNGFQKCHVQT